MKMEKRKRLQDSLSPFLREKWERKGRGKKGKE